MSRQVSNPFSVDSQSTGSLMTASSGFLEDVQAADNYLLSVGDPSTILTHSLSLDAVAVSTTSTIAENHQQAFRNQAVKKWRKIGTGQCGTVFEQVGTIVALKKANTEHPDIEAALWNDFQQHCHIQNVFENFGLSLCKVPAALGHFVTNSSFWQENQSLFPDASDAAPGHAILAERILPIPSKMRNALIELFCPQTIRAAALNSAGNRDCLIRLYLGKRRDPQARPSRFFNLRNFGLSIDMMESLRLPISQYLNVMTEALAGLHWAAKVDGRDVEFVLGSQPIRLGDRPKLSSNFMASSIPYEVKPVYQFTKRIVSVWLLDFNQVKPITWDEAGMRAAADAFIVNDPYFPRPKDAELWKKFKTMYIEHAKKIIERIVNKPAPNLPTKFLQLIEERTRPVPMKENVRPTWT